MGQRAICTHNPRMLVPNGGKHKDGTPQLQCKECIRLTKWASRRRLLGYDEQFERQGGLCVFCGLPLDRESNKTHRDHNHQTGEQRGLVHARCNQMISGIEDAMALLGVERIVQWMRRIK